MISEFRPFEVLKLIRDRIITNVNDLGVGSSRFYFNKDRFVKGLLSLGWIELTKDGNITPTERIRDTQEALGVSLTELSPYDANSVVCNPLLGRPSQPRCLC